MKNKYKKIEVLLGTILVIAVIVLIGLIFVKHSNKETIYSEKTPAAEPLTINTKSPKVDGSVTVMDEDRNIYYQYDGTVCINHSSDSNYMNLKIIIPPETDAGDQNID